MTDLIGQAGRRAAEGMRVTVTDPGRIWEREKAGRGDPSQGGEGTVLEVREEGTAPSTLIPKPETRNPTPET